jgi:phosphatidylinositol alpha-1,6-mannosyltransferase
VTEHLFLGLFPYFGEDKTGGVELSGRISWRMISQNFSYYTIHAICYHPTGIKSTISDENVNIGYTRQMTAAHTLKFFLNKKDIIVWHIDLIKLIPLLLVRQNKVILFLHGIEVWRKASLLETHLLTKVDLFLSNSHYTWKRFVEFNPNVSNKAHKTVHLGAFEAFTEEIPQPSDQPIAIIISRLASAENYKGHEQIISVWHKVLEDIPNAQFWIVGDGDLLPILERQVEELNLQQFVKFYGWISEEKKQELLLQARCLLMPSRGEGFGLVYLEAMRLGRPCLVSNFDAGREVVNPPEAGLSIDPDNTVGLATAICRLLTLDENWYKWSQNAQNRFNDNFTSSNFQRRLLDALQQNS